MLYTSVQKNAPILEYSKQVLNNKNVLLVMIKFMKNNSLEKTAK